MNEIMNQNLKRFTLGLKFNENAVWIHRAFYTLTGCSDWSIIENRCGSRWDSCYGIYKEHNCPIVVHTDTWHITPVESDVEENFDI